MRPFRLAAFLSATIVLLAPAATAQTKDDDADHAAGYNAIIDNIDLLVDNYSRFLARKYDLNEEQDEYTKSLLRERAHGFLDKHEDSLRNLVDRMFDVRSGGDMTPEELIEWGKSAQPIYEEAKQLITEGNDEWREILTPEQQKIHDEDVKLMRESFKTTEDQLDRIISGEMTVDEFRSPQKNKRRSRRSRNTAKPRQTPAPSDEALPSDEARGVSRLPDRGNATTRDKPGRRITREGRMAPTENDDGVRAPRNAADRRDRTPKTTRRTPGKRASAKSAGKGNESKWEKYVREFIAKYKLNDEQTQKANAILDDCKARAAKHLSSRKSRFDVIDKELATLKKSKDKNKSKAMAELNKQRAKLMAPIDQIFEKQLKPRLEKLPTRAQRRAAEAAAKKKPPTKNKKKKTKSGD